MCSEAEQLRAPIAIRRLSWDSNAIEHHPHVLSLHLRTNHLSALMMNHAITAPQHILGLSICALVSPLNDCYQLEPPK